jgi:hypothetical protein
MSTITKSATVRNLNLYLSNLPITVAARSKVYTTSTAGYIGTVGSNPTQMDICVCSMFVLSWIGRGLATG